MASETDNQDSILSYEEEPKEESEEGIRFEDVQQEDPEVQQRIRSLQIEKTKAITAIQNRQSHYYGAYSGIFLDLFDQQIALESSKTEFTNSLLRNGFHVNASRVYSKVEMVSARLAHIALTQRLIEAMGLHYLHDTIIEHELSVLYKTTQVPAKAPPPDQSRYRKDGTREDLPIEKKEIKK